MKLVILLICFGFLHRSYPEPDHIGPYYFGTIPPDPDEYERRLQEEYARKDTGGMSLTWWRFVDIDVNAEVPENFDARERWPECTSIAEIITQGGCGNCWAVSLGTTISDRVCIASNGTKTDYRASVEDFTSCCHKCSPNKDNCHGASASVATEKQLFVNGIVTGGDVNSGYGCKPYSQGLKEGVVPPCVHKCTNPEYKIPYGKDKLFLKAASVYQITPINMSLSGAVQYNLSKFKEIQIEIMTHGPVMVMAFMSNKFSNDHQDKNKAPYGVWTGPNEFTQANHGLRLIGWGVEDGVPYWLGANSWGTKWGNGGFFKLLRGQNMLGIEEWTVALYPDINTLYTGSASISKSSLVALLCALCVIYLF